MSLNFMNGGGQIQSGGGGDMDRQIDRQIEKQIDRQINRQINREIENQIDRKKIDRQIGIKDI